MSTILRTTAKTLVCWGGRIRTSDWLIQSSVCGKCHASFTSKELWDNNSTDNYGRGGQVAS